jgi:hypothetical protein
VDFRLRQDAGLRPESLDDAPHKGPDAGGGDQDRRFAVARCLFEFVAHQIDELGERGGLHREIAVVALADDGFGKGLLPFGRQSDDRQRAIRHHMLSA